MKEQLLKDIKTGFDSLNEKLSKMLNLLNNKPPLTIKSNSTRKHAGFRLALRIKEFYVFKQMDKIIGLRLDGTPCCIWSDEYSGAITIAEFYDTKESGLLKGYPLLTLQDPNFWNKETTQLIGTAVIDNYDNSLINVEYDG